MNTVQLCILIAAGSSVFFSIFTLLEAKRQSFVASIYRKELAEAQQETRDLLNRLREDLREDLDKSSHATVDLTGTYLHNFGSMVFKGQKTQADLQDSRLAEMNEGIRAFTTRSENKLEDIRRDVHNGLGEMRKENSAQLDKMRETVDEKLEQTLNARISQSFRLVSDRLQQVYEGLGEMQNLAAGVGDLKKVLTNVKMRGTMGEVQLGSILGEILSPDQYDTNVETKRGSRARVEYAVKMPGFGRTETFCYLPIDAKFPGDTYAHLVDAYQVGDKEQIEKAAKALEQVIKQEATDIRDKYLDPPYTTNFAIMFLPFEGLYAEVLRRGLFDVLQRQYGVNIAGPSTMAALLNSLRMGFRTLAIQKHSSHVWEVLGAVRTEFDKFGDILTKAQRKISQANLDLDQLIGARTNVIKRKLRDVERIDEQKAAGLLAWEADSRSDREEEEVAIEHIRDR